MKMAYVMLKLCRRTLQHGHVSSTYNQCLINNIAFSLRSRNYGSQKPKSSGFFGKFVTNIKQEIAKNKEMKENLKKFRQEAEKLEHSDALKKARQKYESVESEASRSSELLKEKIGSFKDKMQDVLGEASKSDIAKKAGELGSNVRKTAIDAAEAISEKGAQVGRIGAMRTITRTAKAVKKEIDESSIGAAGAVYRSPHKLRKRVQVSLGEQSEQIAPDDHTTGVELHKDSKFYQSWQQFKDNNAYMNKILDWKIRYDESESTVVRASRFVTDKVSDLVGGLFQKTELSEVLTEICKLDPSFDKAEFLKLCEQHYIGYVIGISTRNRLFRNRGVRESPPPQKMAESRNQSGNVKNEGSRKEIIPNVLEAIIRPDLDILRDWCYEAPYNVISEPIKEALKNGYRFDSKILDVDGTDLLMGKMMEHGPVLIISFQAQQIVCVRDRHGSIVEGDPQKVLRVSYVWALCRDISELNPRAAWKLLEMSANSTEQLL